MAYVVTQSCCADAACVVACPVNCIHPAPGEPGFAEAEMLYVDADSCVGCGACATACPAGAIVPAESLTPAQQPFVALNAEYYDVFPHRDRTPLAVVAPQRRLRRPGPFRVAVVGAGPAGMYTADELLKHPEVSVDVYDRLPTPGGLVRAGVAPDHPATKQVETLFRQIERERGFRYFLNVEVGRDLSHDELAAQYHAVVYTVGASADRSLGIEGEHLPGSLSATDLVGWYNGHPDHQDLTVPLGHERAVVVGNGNVALDVARILTADPEALERTDIATLPLTALRRSAVREVVVLGRRGPAQAAFTVPELIGLAGIEGLDVEVDLGPGCTLDASTTAGRVLAEMAARPRREGLPRIVLRFATSPVRVLGGEHEGVTGVELVRNRLETGPDGRIRPVPTEETQTLACGLVLRAVGYHGRPVADLPYDAETGTVPHERGRVRPGVYVAGWVKRGPSGFIGTNKSCAQETVEQLLDDLDRTGSDTLPEPVGTPESIRAVVLGRRPRAVELAGWHAIDACRGPRRARAARAAGCRGRARRPRGRARRAPGRCG